MMLSHKKDSGLVYFDSMYRNENFIDLACMMCGARWHVKKNNPLARLLLSERKS